jgi:hypothetical protein
MSNIMWDALRIRRENQKPPEPPRRITEGELLGLLLSARLNAEMSRGKQWADLVDALEELKSRRWEEQSRG